MLEICGLIGIGLVVVAVIVAIFWSFFAALDGTHDAHSALRRVADLEERIAAIEEWRNS
jgi:uncharacterized membrane protein YukC